MSGYDIGGGGGGPGSDTTAIHDNIAGEIAAVALKAVPVSADLILIEDSAAADVKKRVTAQSIADLSGGLTLWVESEDSTLGNPSTIWTPVTATNHILLQLDGGTTGALYVGAPQDGTATGGNARGAGAVDLQMSRTAAAQVASGDHAFIGAGENNTASGGWAGMVGGHSNVASANYAVAIGGFSSTASGLGSGVFAGDDLTASGQYAVSIGGENNSAEITHSAVVGGINGRVWTFGGRSVVVGGNTNQVAGSDSGIFAGKTNQITSTASTSGILGGDTNQITGSGAAAIIGGANNTVQSAGYAAIVGGRYCLADAQASVVTGWMGESNHPTAFVFSGNSETAGTAQRGLSQGELIHLDAKLSTATTGTLDSIGTQLSVPTDHAFGVRGKVVARNATSDRMTTWLLDFDVFESGGALVFLGGDGLQAISRQTAGEAAITLTIGSSGTTITLTVDNKDTDTRRYSATLEITRAGDA